jgi:hypothetical protein
MLILLALLGCTDPEVLAVSACEAVPGLSTDTAGLTALEPLLTPSAFAILKEAEPTEGQKKLGEAGLAQIRAGTSCTVAQVDPAGSGRWAVKLKRTAPVVGPDGAIGAAEETEFEWQVVDSDGGRVDVGMEKAASMRRSVAEAVEKGELRRAASTLRTLSRSFPDPALAVDVALAEAALERADYASKLSNTFVDASDTEVHATFTNSGDRPVGGVSVGGNFETPEGEVVATATLGEVAAGASVEYTLAIPEGASGKVKLSTEAYALQ